MDEKSFGEAIILREQGEFEKATRAFQVMLDQTSPTLEQQDRRTVEFEIERIRRIRQDYSVNRERLLSQLRRKLVNITEEELEQFEREGKLDVQVIDGQKRYVNSSASNLVLRVPDLQNRLKQHKPDIMYRRLYNEMLKVRAAQALTSSSLLLPQDIAVTYTLVVEPNAAPADKVIRCWLPFVRAFPYHTDIYITDANPANYVLAPLEAAHRTAYFESIAVKDQPSTFAISFIYRSWSRANEINPAAVQPYAKDAPPYAYYSAEHKPHIDFANDELKKLNEEIVAGEANPYLAAKRIYDWIANNTIYQYAREYSTLDNIAHYTATRRAGDCGQHGMLFIALCRMNGIPARWTTGWECFNKNGNNMHDWCEFYVEPHGWLPADPDIAVNLIKHVDGELTTSQSKQLADWLFGNMDSLRLTVNSDFSSALYPPKQNFRSETVDFQRGEVECEGKNLYFDTWNYDMEMKLIPRENADRTATAYVPSIPVDLLDVSGTYRPETSSTQVTELAANLTSSTASTSGPMPAVRTGSAELSPVDSQTSGPSEPVETTTNTLAQQQPLHVETTATLPADNVSQTSAALTSVETATSGTVPK